MNSAAASQGGSAQQTSHAGRILHLGKSPEGLEQQRCGSHVIAAGFKTLPKLLATLPFDPLMLLLLVR